MKNFKIFVAIAIGVSIFSIMSCGKGGGNAPSESSSLTPITPTIIHHQKFQLMETAILLWFTEAQLQIEIF